MLKTPCLHTGILKTLSKCGHGDKVLIADGNYPIESKTNVITEKVYLNLTHGIPLVTDVLKVINETINIEKCEVMIPEDKIEPPIYQEFEETVSSIEQLDTLGRFEYYKACRSEEVKLAIATGEERVYANILITVGVA